MSMSEVTKWFYEQMSEGEKLDAVIKENMEVLGYGE